LQQNCNRIATSPDDDDDHDADDDADELCQKIEIALMYLRTLKGLGGFGLGWRFGLVVTRWPQSTYITLHYIFNVA